MTAITTTAPFRTFANGRTLSQVEKPGTITDGSARDGSPRALPYGPGAVILAGSTGEHLAGPLDVTGAEQLAVAVIEGDARTLTSPGLDLRLASAVLALIADIERMNREREVPHGQG